MTDIVERLLRLNYDSGALELAGATQAAASEITRLRAAITYAVGITIDAMNNDRDMSEGEACEVVNRTLCAAIRSHESSVKADEDVDPFPSPPTKPRDPR